MGKIAELPVGCVGQCERVATASIVTTDNKGVFGALPPDGWLINGADNLLMFCCAECEKRLGFVCECKTSKHSGHHHNNKRTRQ